MKKVIIDYKKLTPKLLELLANKFPDGYYDKDIITFENHKNEIIEAVEVTYQDTTYLVKVSSKLHYTMTNFDTVEAIETDASGHVIIDTNDASLYEEEE